jgi:hypothetical protein
MAHRDDSNLTSQAPCFLSHQAYSYLHISTFKDMESYFPFYSHEWNSSPTGFMYYVRILFAMPCNSFTLSSS